MTRVAQIIDTGVANVASLLAGLRRLGVAGELTTSAHVVAHAPLVVLPGVGAFRSGMTMLRRHGLEDALRARCEADLPLLAVCLGMQMLCAASEESPGVPGLGVIDAVVTRFPREASTPQLGWNCVNPESGMPFAPGDAYFANSYCVRDCPAGWSAATSTHVVPFVSALHRGRTLACQFHPELSGRWGASVLAAWITLATGANREEASC